MTPVRVLIWLCIPDTSTTAIIYSRKGYCHVLRAALLLRYHFRLCVDRRQLSFVPQWSRRNSNTAFTYVLSFLRASKLRVGRTGLRGNGAKGQLHKTKSVCYFLSRWATH